ncbi:flagellin, partial [Hydrogenophaga palleronii]|uniref:flagellin n=1 Tax=Hydrogenophaga palleronii TaxID=65655 RepID=UPI0024811051
FANATFQVGANAGEGIAIDSIVSANSSTLGRTSINTAAAGNAGTLTAIADGALSVGGVSLGPIAAAATGAERTTQVIDAINAKSSNTGIFARATYTAGAVSGMEVFSDRTLVAGDFTGAAWGTTASAAAPVIAGAASNRFASDINVNSFGDSQLALKVIDNAINAINSSRADLGALQSRFENAVANIQITGENISAA